MSADILDRIPVGAYTLARGEWGVDEPTIISRVSARRPYRGGRAWRRLRVQADRTWQLAERSGRRIYGRPPDPPGLLRLVDFSLAGPDGNLELFLQPTWFWSLLGSNVAASISIRQGDWGLAVSEAFDPKLLAGSFLANPLSVNLVIVAGQANPKLLVQRRARVVARGGEKYQVSAAGFVDYADHGSTTLGTPWRAAVREADEETGIRLDPEGVRFIGLCRSRGTFVPGLCGIAQVDEAVLEQSLSASHDSFEVEGYEWWPFRPDDVFGRVLMDGGWNCFVALGAAAMVFALVLRYGEEAVVNSWKKLERAKGQGTSSAPGANA